MAVLEASRFCRVLQCLEALRLPPTSWFMVVSKKGGEQGLCYQRQHGASPWGPSGCMWGAPQVSNEGNHVCSVTSLKWEIIHLGFSPPSTFTTSYLCVRACFHGEVKKPPRGDWAECTKNSHIMLLEQCLAQEIRAWLIVLQRRTQVGVCMALCRCSGMVEGFLHWGH